MRAVMATGAPSRRTIFGLERRGLGWTLAIGAVAFVLAVGLPILDAAIPTDNLACCRVRDFRNFNNIPSPCREKQNYFASSP